MRSRSRHLAVYAAVLLGAAWDASAAAQAAPPPAGGRTCDVGALRARLAEPRRAAMADNRISLVVPEGMRTPTAAEARRNAPPGSWRSGEMLGFSAGEGASIVVTRLPAGEGSPVDVPEFRRLMTSMLRLAVPEVEMTSEIVQRGGARWLQVRPVRGARGASSRHYATFLATSFQGSGVIAMFLVRDDPRLRAAMERSAASLEVHDCAVPAGEAAPSTPASSSAAPAAEPRACDAGELRARLAADRRRVAADGGRVSLLRPEGMAALTRAEIEEVYPKDALREQVFVNDPVTALIAVWLTDNVSMIDMPRYRQALEKELESRHPDLRWIGREVVELGGTRWLRMEYTARQRETDRHFQMYVTSFQGRTLIVDMRAHASEAARWTAEHARVVESIELRDCSLPPEAASWPR